MNARLFLQLVWIAALTLPSFTAPASPPMDADFSAVGTAVVELLKSRDVSRFVSEMAPTADDFQSVLKNDNEPQNNPEAYRRSVTRSITSTARAVLADADSLHLNFSNSNLYAQVILPESIGQMYFNGNPRDARGASPYVRRLEIVLTPTPDENAKPSPNGDFKIAATGLVKFPSGWKPDGGIQWADFPSTVANEKTRHTMAILQKADGSRELTDKDDPALLQLANAVIHFIREGNLAIFQQNALAGDDEVFSLDQRLMQGEPDAPGITRQDFDSNWDPQRKEWIKASWTLLEIVWSSGVDFKNGQIKVTSASVQQPRLMGPRRISLDGLQGEQFQIQFTVKSGGKSRNGTPIDGDYTLTAAQILRLGDHWKIIGNLRWDDMPPGLLNTNAEATMQLESYVGKHGSLPSGTIAPDIEFTRLDNGQKMKLSDLRGKVVVLDFWATWCGPCQEPMARLQTLPGEHPNWKGQVAVVPLSIDDTIQIVRHHVEQRGWTNTFNVWAGEGGWTSAAATAFRVKGVPTTYIIDPHGKIIRAGHPAMMNIDDEVNAQLILAKQ